MDETIVKAFVLCDEVRDSPGSLGRKDLLGAGLTVIRATEPFPIKRTFWAYVELTSQKPDGDAQLAIMRADSGRRYYFRIVPVRFADRLQVTKIAIRVFDTSFPIAGVYYVELWYNGDWVIDQRLEVV